MLSNNHSRRGFVTAGAVATVSSVHALLSGADRADAEPSAERPTPDTARQFPEGALVDVRDFGAVGDARTDDTDAIQNAIDLATTLSAAVVLPPGRYAVRELRIPERSRVIGLGSGSTQFPTPGQNGDRRFDAVEIVPCDRRSSPLLTLVGAGITLEHVTIDGYDYRQIGGGDPLGSPRIGVVVESGFETELTNIRVHRFRDSGIVVRRANNATWRNVFVDTCGTDERPAMTIESGSDGAATNFLLFEHLTVQHSANVGLAIGWGTDPVTAWAAHLTFLSLHLESTNDDGRERFNRNALLQIGNVRDVVFLSSYVLGLAAPLVEYHHQLTGDRHDAQGGPVSDPGNNEGTVQFIGGQLSQRGTPPGFAVQQAAFVLVTRGRDFMAQSVRFDELRVPAVTIESTMEKPVLIDATCSFRFIGVLLPEVDDRRPGWVKVHNTLRDTLRTTQTEIVRFERQVFAHQDRGLLEDPSDPGSRRFTALDSAHGDVTEAYWGFGSNGNDIAGTIACNVAKPVPAFTAFVSVRFKRPYPTPPVVTITPANGSAARSGPYVVPLRDGTGFDVAAANGLLSTGQHLFSFHVIGMGLGANAP